MRSDRKCLILTGVVIIGAIFILSSCSSKPSKSELTGAINALINSNETHWQKCGPGQVNPSVSTEAIEEIGNFNKDGKYWPVKAKISGTVRCWPYHITNEQITININQLGEFQVFKDDFGNWKARWAK